MSPKKASVPAKVFISHSHRDRKAATELQRVLTKYGAETYLDQDEIQVGDILPDRIQQGIEWCNSFLLLWSSSAAISEWVRREWNTAYELRRKVIPYCLDSTPLPPGLDSLVYLDRKDAQVAHAGLLRAVIKGYVPPPTDIFPGSWRVTLDAFGFGTATHDLELRANGQITGTCKVDRGGPLEAMLTTLGVSDLLNLQFSVSGAWEYEEHTKILTLDMTAHGFGQEFREKLQIRVTSREPETIQGQDFSGRTYTLRRLPGPELKEALLHLERMLSERALSDFKAVQATPAVMQQALDGLSGDVDALAKHRSAVLQTGRNDLGEQFDEICKLGSRLRPLWDREEMRSEAGMQMVRALVLVLAEKVAKFRNECFGDE